MALPRLIGITGKAGSGKDTLADHLVETHGYHKYSLSQPIKQLLNERFGWTDKDWLDRAWKESDLPHMGWRWKPNPEKFSPRSWAQWLGTEVGRNIGGPDVWANMMEREWKTLRARLVGDCYFCRSHTECRCGEAPYKGMVVPDVRFENEAQRIIQLGGVVIRVVRPDAAPISAHVSEQGIPDCLVNVQVENDKDISTYLRNATDALVNCPRGV